jgi:hypothetical protein
MGLSDTTGPYLLCIFAEIADQKNTKQKTKEARLRDR